uniref:Uncharacterized protein n=1 Tax=Knipowitschia caucasica TaxID=637954 RepID=A0AAV2LSM6_KNICA
MEQDTADQHSGAPKARRRARFYIEKSIEERETTVDFLIGREITLTSGHGNHPSSIVRTRSLPPRQRSQPWRPLCSRKEESGGGSGGGGHDKTASQPDVDSCWDRHVSLIYGPVKTELWTELRVQQGGR